jgi:hypothetical protein
VKTYLWRTNRPSPAEIRAHAITHPVPNRPGAGWWQRRTYDGAPVMLMADEHGIWGDRERVDSSFAGEEWRPVDADADAVAWPTPSKGPSEPDAVMAQFFARVAEIELPGEAVAVWMRFRADLAPLPVGARLAAWRAIGQRAGDVGRLRNAKVWLKKAIAEEDARRMGDQNGRGSA